MKKIAIAAVAALSLAGAVAPAADAGVEGPCEKQQRLFDKYNIEFGMMLPDEVNEAYTATCDRTG